ncbi:MAG: S-methyl-5'-thioinosine phosphorylase [Gammaproteobacteria bacterium]
MKTLAIVGGSGAGMFPDLDSAELVPGDTRWGRPSSPVRAWEQHGHRVLFLSRHGELGSIAPHAINYRANMQFLADLGADKVVATNAVGGIAATAGPGALVIPNQLIDYTWGREHSIYDADSAVEFIDFTEPYDVNLRENMVSAAAAAGVEVISTGAYAATQGPRLETPAEIDRLEKDGCTIVGMTGMPEAALARELGLAYASCCSVVNYAAGRTESSIHAEMAAHLEQGITRTAAIIDQLLQADKSA